MKYELHPACAAWPLMSNADIDALADDIKVNTLREPLTLTPDGLLLDGRNREEACARAGVTPTTVVYDGNPVLFSLSKNKHRRHMSRDQIAIVAAALVTTTLGANQFEGVANATSINDAAVAAGIRRDEINSGLAIIRDGTEEDVANVKSGKAKLRKTADTVRKRKKGEQLPVDKAREAVRPLIASGKKPHAETIAKQLGVTRRVVNAAVNLERERASDPSGGIMVSIDVLIEKLVPLFERVKAQATKHTVLVSKPELLSIASEGRRLLDGWASGDETVRRARGHVVPFKRPTKRKGVS